MAGADTRREEDALEDAREAFERATEAHSENYNNALDDWRFARLGEQWPERIRRDREMDGRPCLTINRLPAFIRQVINDARQNKPAIAVHPVDSSSDPETAEIMNGLIRHIEQSSDADVAYDTALEGAVTGGFGWFKINTRYATDDGFDQDVVIEPVQNVFSILPDPDSTSADSADWNSAFEIDSLTRGAWKKRWPDADAVPFDARGSSRKPVQDGEMVQYAIHWTREQTMRKIVAVSPPSQDAPEDLKAQADGLGEGMILDLSVYEANKKLFDALGVTIVGRPREVPSHKVTQRLYSGADELETIDWAGKYIPIVPVYGEDINIEGRRYLRSLVRDAVDPQRMFNYWRTTSTELVALAPKAPFIGKAGQFVTDASKWATANTETHAYIEYDDPVDGISPGPPQRQPFAGVPAGALQEALNASDDMKSIMGIFDAGLGARSNETSGKAIMARQRESDVSTFHFIDNLSRAIRHAGRIMLDLIPKVYATPRVIRILGPEGDAKVVSIAPRDQGPEQGAQQPGKYVQGADTEGPGEERAEDIERIYDLGLGKYDLTVTAGPSFTSRREEAATQMIELMRAYPAAAPIMGDLLAKNLDWPGADEIAERFKALLPQQVQGENPEAQAAAAQIKKLAELLGEAKAKLQAMESDHSIDARKVEIDAFNAETGRMKAIAPKGVEYDPMQMAPVVMTSLLHILQSPDILEAAQSGAPPEQVMQALMARMQPQAAGGGGMGPPQPPATVAAPVEAA